MFKGRKVANPVVQGAGGGAYPKDSDFARAWNNVGKARSELRKIEHRLGEVHNAPVYLNETGNPSVRNYSSLMENQNFNEFPSGAVVDKYGRSNVMRNREQRKISRKDNKHNEDDEDMMTGNKTDSKRVDFRERQELREINPDGTFTDVPGGQHLNSTYIRPNSPQNSIQTTLTDSRAIRETEIRFLNEPTSQVQKDQRRVMHENKLTHVDVTVPGATKTSSSNKHSTHYPRTTNAFQSNGKEFNNDIKLTEIEHQWETASTDSAQSDDAPMKRKFKKSIKDIGEGGLAKIKEKIKRQQEKASPRENKENADSFAMGAPEMNCNTESHRQLHNDNDPVQAGSHNFPMDGIDKHPKRKVAAGPPVPTYKGFSETEVKYKHTEIKVPKDKKKEKKKRQNVKLPKSPEPVKEEDDKQERKPTRVIAKANKKEASKQKKNEIITTSSWRAGQELVNRELGPLKTRRTFQTSQIIENDRGSHQPDGAVGGVEEVDTQERKSATDMELERARVLSAEARRVLSDLNIDSDEEDRKREESSRRTKSAIKRKAPKFSVGEGDKHSQIKQRHYDAEEIRHYIQQKKAERLKRQIDEDKRQKKADELRRKQLEELYSKQKQTAAHSNRFREIKHKSNSNTTFSRPMALSDLPRHHPFQAERSRQMMTSDSEPLPGEDEMEMSDGSSTLTGDSMDEETPLDTPKGQNEDKQKPSQTSQWKASLQKEREFLMEKNNSKNIGGFTFDLNSVFTKFSQAVSNQQSESESRPLSVNSGYSAGAAPSNPPRPSTEGSDRTREQRLQAIKETAKHLQEKIQNEARKLTGETVEDGSGTNQRWAYNRHNNDGDYVSRYDRMTDAGNDYSVFTSNLPGLQRNSTFNDTEDDTNPAEAAAIRIQAAYRGHTVRQNLNTWKLPSGGTVGSHIRHPRTEEDESSITETSTFSEITITEDSENSLLSNQRRVGTGLRDRDFHVGGHRTQGSAEMVIPRPTTHQPRDKYSWEEPKPDPDNVFNIFARHQRSQERQRTGYSAVSIEPQKIEEEFKKDHVSSQQAAPKVSRSAQNSQARTRSPGVGARSNSPGFGLRTESPQGPAHHSLRSRNEETRQKTSVSFKPVSVESEQDDTLHENSYSRPFEMAKDDRSNLKSEKASSLSHTKPSQKRSADFDTDTSSVEEFSRAEDHERHYPHVHSEDDSTPKASLRYSPDTLERKFYTELNQLESMEESMRQLTGVERTRAVSMAQQETVSLAQMLKARQQTHDRDMKLLEIKVQQEKQEAAKIEQQMDKAKHRSKEAAQTAKEVMTRVQGDGKEDRTAAKYNSIKLNNSDNIRPKRGAKQSPSTSEYKGQPDSARTYSGKSTLKTITQSYSSSRSLMSNVKTASDTQRGGDSDSSIRSVSGADARDESKSESILEDISQASGDEYSINFDDTMTEDEIEEKSFKAILPSESHRKRAKKHHLDNMSVTSDEGSVPNTPRVTVDDLGSYVIGEDSFNKFTEEMVKQFMKEEEMRAQHQASLLQLREKALVEKTKAELDWLEQQKQRIRNKGADDSYPNIVKRQRGLKMKLQEQQAEIKRMQEANKAASRERQMLLQQREEINRLRHSTKQTKDRLGGRLSRPAEVHTEDEFYMNEDGKDTDNETSQKKDYKSDSEIYTEVKSAAGGEKSMDKYKKIHLDERYLTKREQRLRDRKKTAKELLDWKKRLDEEEQEIYELEKKALKVWDHKKGKKKEKDSEKVKTPTKRDAKDSHTTHGTPSIAHDDTIISESISIAKDESLTNTPHIVSESSPVERQNQIKLGRSESESSIVEEVQTEYSNDETTPVRSRKSRPQDSATIDSQYSETFEDATSVQTSRKSSKSPRSPLDKLSKRGLQMGALTGRNIRSFKSKTRSCSESESEESISHTDVSYAETQSDLSDFEGRVRALNDELKTRKQVADRLKRERKKRKREILKSKEDALKKQIEAYDNQISQLKEELQKEMEHDPVKAGVKPQIKKPQVSPPKSLKSPPLKQNDERSSNSSYDESSQNSPTIIDDKDSKALHPDPKSAVTPSKIPTKVSLDKISEGSESSKSQATVEAKRRIFNEIEDDSIKEQITENIQEEISEVDSYTEKSKTSSGLLKIPKSPKSDVKSPRDDYSLKSDIKSPRDDDYSYTQDFDDVSTHKITSAARSLPQSETVDFKPLPSPRSITENIISEVISEHVGSHLDDDSFIKPLSNIQDVNIDNEESDIESKSPPSTTKDDSRPSSGKSVSSFYDESESDRSNDIGRLRIVSSDKYSEEVTTDESPIHTGRRGESMIPGGVFDIDQLIGPNQEEEDDETPLASPREEDVQSTTEDERTEDYHDFTVGDRVQVTGPNGNRQCGTLMFKGRVKFAPGIWAGVELESSDGRINGTYEGECYFTCRPNHGVLVPANDMSNAPLPQMRSPVRTSQDSLIRSSLESNISVNTSGEQEELNKLIKEADENVRSFDEVSSKKPNHDVLADKITDDILVDLVSKERDFISNKSSPPVAPKPQRPKDGIVTNGSENILVNGDIKDLADEIYSPKNSKTTNITDKLVDCLLDDALSKMIKTRNKQRSRGGEVENLIDFDDFNEEKQENRVEMSPSEELLGVLNKPDSPIIPEDVPQRPSSPLPGSKPKGLNQNDLANLQSDMKDLLGDEEDEYFDDELPALKPDKAPPPYPGSEEAQNMKAELQKMASEDLYYAVPHESEEVQGIVADAVEVYWQSRRCGEQLDSVQIPENYYSKDDTNGDIDSNSRRVYKKLLFDLSGEVIRDIYKDEEDEPPPWQKPKRRQQKYFRGATPPSTIDNLTPIVQQAVINTLGLNGSRKADKNKWTVRKRKDHVDNILVEELREEEPRWINYDEDELAVKMQLSDTIFDMLLNDTVQTMNQVYQKKKLGSKV